MSEVSVDSVLVGCFECIFTWLISLPLTLTCKLCTLKVSLDDLEEWDGSEEGGSQGRGYIIHIFDSLRCTAEEIDITL